MADVAERIVDEVLANVFRRAPEDAGDDGPPPPDTLKRLNQFDQL